jgi:hypothetical protein
LYENEAPLFTSLAEDEVKNYGSQIYCPYPELSEHFSFFLNLPNSSVCALNLKSRDTLFISAVEETKDLKLSL